MTLEQAFAPSDEQEQYALALGESQIIASAATAALIRNRIGCGGAEALEEPCNCCGNQTACAALSKADDFIESEVEEG